MVGGVGPENFSSWFNAGATGFGIGSGIYKAGDSPESVSIKSNLIVQSYDQAKK
jgi:2-dehydro-3-deoxyphosphogalactonate aldolase